LVLNKIRSKIEPATLAIGSSLGKAGFGPTLLTCIGFLFAVFAGLLYGLRPGQPYLAAAAIVVSGVMDILDGAVARATQKVSKKGSLTDSTLDRLAEVAIFGGVIYGGYSIQPVVVLLALSFSLLVSYVRAKGESLNIVISGIGIGERAERLLVMIAFSLIGYVWIGVYVVLILAAFTFVQRFIHVFSKLT
jgi:archaetidylinositol phosphate synthase